MTTLASRRKEDATLRPKMRERGRYRPAGEDGLRTQLSRAARGRTLRILASIAGLALFAAACSNQGDDTAAQPDGPATQRGAEVYASNCASCHGTDLRGTDQGPSHLSIVYEPNHHTDDAFRSAIANGSPAHHWSFGPMPPIGGIAEDDVNAVIAYVRAEQQRQGFEQ